MGRKRGDNSKVSRIYLRETAERKKKLDEYAKLNRMSLADYIRDALRIRDEMTREQFHLRVSEYEFDDYFDDSCTDENDDFEY